MTIREYTLSHWNEYNLTDTYEDFLKLLNILEYHGESLDSLHDFSGYDTFCSIYFSGVVLTDREIVKVLDEYHYFWESEDEIKSFYEKWTSDESEEDRIPFEEFKDMYEVSDTTDGIVGIIRC